MSDFPELPSRFNAIPIKILAEFVFSPVEIDKLILKLIWK